MFLTEGMAHGYRKGGSEQIQWKEVKFITGRLAWAPVLDRIARDISQGLARVTVCSGQTDKQFCSMQVT